MWVFTMWLVIMATKLSIVALASFVMSMFFGQFLLHLALFTFSAAVFEWVIGSWREAKRIISEAGECK